MFSTSTSNQGNPARIAVNQKGTTLKEMEVDTNLEKWLNFGRRILGTSGWHLIH
jgi:hypothetical protein